LDYYYLVYCRGNLPGSGGHSTARLVTGTHRVGESSFFYWCGGGSILRPRRTGLDARPYTSSIWENIVLDAFAGSRNGGHNRLVHPPLSAGGTQLAGMADYRHTGAGAGIKLHDAIQPHVPGDIQFATNAVPGRDGFGSNRRDESLEGLYPVEHGIIPCVRNGCNHLWMEARQPEAVDSNRWGNIVRNRYIGGFIPPDGPGHPAGTFYQHGVPVDCVSDGL